MSHLDFAERDVLKTILRVGGPNLAVNLEMWGEWLKEIQEAKFDPMTHPHFPLTLLSLMGIHGKAART